MLLIIRNYLKLPFLTICYSVIFSLSFAQDKPKIQQQELYDNLIDEKCVARPRFDMLPPPGLPVDKMIYCNDQLVASVSAEKLTSIEEGEDFKAKLMDTYANSRVYNLNSKRMRCEDKTTNLAKIKWENALAYPCKLSNGGWPHLVVLLPRKDKLYIAEGAPSLLPTLISAVYPRRKEEPTKSAYTESLQEIFGGPVPLASSKDLKNFDKILADARTANTQGRYQDSESLFRKALDLQTKLLNENDISIAETLMDLALNVSNQGRDEEALALFRRAEPIIQVSPNDSDRARFASYQGYHEANSKRYDKALQFASGAVGSWRKIAAGPSIDFSSLFGESSDADPRAAEKGELALALNLQANMALRLEQNELAQAAASEALQILNDTDGLPRWWKADILLTLGKIASAQGRLSAAEKFLNTALAERGISTGDGPHLLPIRFALAKAYTSEAMHTSSIITYRQIFKKIKSFPVGTKVNIKKEDIIPFAASIVQHAKTIKDDKEKQGLFNEAFDAFQLLRPSVVADTIAKASARIAVNDPDLAKLLADVQNAERERDAANVELSYESSLPDDQRSKLIEDQLILRKKTAFLQLQKLNKEINTKFPNYATLTAPKPLNTLDFRNRIGATEGAVSFIVGENKSFVQLIRRDGIFIGEIKEGEESLNESVQSLRSALELKAGTINEFDASLAYSLYNRRFNSVRDKLLDLNHLIIIPSGPLASLPFSLLIEENPKDEGYEKVSWMVNRMAFSYSPSLKTFYSQRTAAKNSKPTKKLFALANPLLTGEKVQRKDTEKGLTALATSCRQAGPASSDLIRSLAPLPDTESEVNNVKNSLGKTEKSQIQIFTRKDANEKNLRNVQLDDYRVLYFATHGLLPGELKCQAEPGLVLTPPKKANSRDNDGLLEASEIASLKLNADLVVLSACNTAGSGGKFGGDALSGLAEAFFYAGAKSLVVSHWQVPSKATASLMSKMFEELGTELELGASLAMRKAQTALISKKETSHPFFWAAFVVVGDGIADSWLPIPRGEKLAKNTN